MVWIVLVRKQPHLCRSSLCLPPTPLASELNAHLPRPPTPHPAPKRWRCLLLEYERFSVSTGMRGQWSSNQGRQPRSTPPPLNTLTACLILSLERRHFSFLPTSPTLDIPPTSPCQCSPPSLPALPPPYPHPPPRSPLAPYSRCDVLPPPSAPFSDVLSPPPPPTPIAPNPNLQPTPPTPSNPPTPPHPPTSILRRRHFLIPTHRRRSTRRRFLASVRHASQRKLRGGLPIDGLSVPEGVDRSGVPSGVFGRSRWRSFLLCIDELIFRVVFICSFINGQFVA